MSDPKDPAHRRQRRNPRGERDERRVRKPATRAPRAVPASPDAADRAVEARTDPVPRMVIDSPTFLIAVVPDLPGGLLTGHDRDLLGAAVRLATSTSRPETDREGAVLAITFEPPHDDLGLAGADRTMQFPLEKGRASSPERRVAALQAVLEQHPVRHILFPDSAQGGGDLGRRLAARLGDRAATAVWRADGGEATRRAGGGRLDVTLPLPRTLLLLEEAAEPIDGVRHEAREMVCPPVTSPPATPVEDGGLLPLDPAAVPITEAEFILAAGDGVGDVARFTRLAERLGASVGGSRVVVDAGQLPRHRQVGASGALVSARCYVALGISGAPQHLEGIAHCDRVIAVNRDPGCDMMKRADLGIVGDVDEIVPALLALIGDDP